MKQEELFLSVEQCRHLQELGLDMSDSAYSWVIQKSRGERELTAECDDVSLVRNLWPSTNICHTYTLDEILRLLPPTIDGGNGLIYNLYVDFKSGAVGYADYPYDSCCVDLCYFSLGRGILFNAYKILCWMIKNNYINERK